MPRSGAVRNKHGVVILPNPLNRRDNVRAGGFPCRGFYVYDDQQALERVFRRLTGHAPTIREVPGSEFRFAMVLSRTLSESLPYNIWASYAIAAQVYGPAIMFNKLKSVYYVPRPR